MTARMISGDIFEAFLRCETKGYLKSLGQTGDASAISSWTREVREDYRRSCHSGCDFISSAVLDSPKPSFLLDCRIETQRLRSWIDGVQRVLPRSNAQYRGYVPIRFVPNEKLSKLDKLLLAFDALALGEALASASPFGRIIHGAQHRIVKITVSTLFPTVRSVIKKILSQAETLQAPQLILNKHCVECEFSFRCRQTALEKSDLSLLSRMSKSEREKLHKRGILSIQQLSYVFKPRRQPKHLASIPHRQFHELKALAIRERKIHVIGQPQMKAGGRRIFLDVEGVPDREFYYLIGLRIRNGELCVRHSFWADDRSDERENWAALVASLAAWPDSMLIYYGGYESTFLKRMIQRYPEVAEAFPQLNRVMSEAVNVLRLVSNHIYFPTYSNSLKEIAQYLGFRWTDVSASGLYSLMWRSQWDRTKDPRLKERIVTYNAEDCAALEIVFDSVLRMSERQDAGVKTETESVVRVESIRRIDSYRFGKIEFLSPDFDYINKAAYWDYQRSKIYVRSSPRLRQLARHASEANAKKLQPNKILECQPTRPVNCPKCHANKIYKYGRLSKTVYDLKFGSAGIKRWIVKYFFPRFLCWSCKHAFTSHQVVWTRSKYGSCFVAYLLYNVVDLHLSQAAVARIFTRFFGFDLGRGAINNIKARAAVSYQDTYDQILTSIVQGKLVQTDETKVSISGRDAFVWVFTNLEAVVYVYSDGRASTTPKCLLSGFRGVLVSDFYAGYDAIDCKQQKCLVHLIRDLNDDLHKQAFNEELKALVHDFAVLIRPMIQTVDRFGLKARFLRKHLLSVERFYRLLGNSDFQSEAALKYKKRFERNRERLFTFLEFDGVPWNNNNAEHAIKALADLRNVIGGASSAKGIHEYLVLLSVCQTCKTKGLIFWISCGWGKVASIRSRASRG
jgi:predicted RecB family nuclease